MTSPSRAGEGGTHTPGPWLTEPGDTIICIRSAAEHGGYRIADVGGMPYWKRFTNTDIANARLIAAAPKLLDAICVIVANARLQPDASMNGTTDIYAVPMDDIENAGRLIAKATGAAS